MYNIDTKKPAFMGRARISRPRRHAVGARKLMADAMSGKEQKP